MFATVIIAGKQYMVAPGDTIIVDHVDGEVGEAKVFDSVLLYSDGTKTLVGTPTVAKIKVTAKITSQEKGEKLHVRRYKQKVRYRKSVGFRAHETTLLIEKIG
jgi:large subunit ribosomal protein L21